MEKVLIHHSEIGLKKGNFSYFERKLMQNIRKILMKNGIEVLELKRHDKRILGLFKGSKENIKTSLMNVFGIKYFSFVEEIEKKVEIIERKVASILQEIKKEEHTKIAFSTKRGDKKFPINSIELNKKLGEISNSLGLKVDYKNSNHTIFIEIPSYNTAYIYDEKILGIGGLPVSTGGRVLCLLSGGIDSPVATWLMMKRGCKVDFLHFHTSSTNKKGFDSKIKKTVEILNKYQIKSKLYLVPYSLYETFVHGNVHQKYDVNLFKHYILKVAEKLAAGNKYDGIVTGDNLAQVASQTISNIKATSLSISEIIFRPLLTYDKQEIINLAHKIDTFNLSVEKYKDCCSIIAKNPATKTKTEVFEKIIDDTNINHLVEKSLKEVEGFKID